MAVIGLILAQRSARGLDDVVDMGVPVPARLIGEIGYRLRGRRLGAQAPGRGTLHPDAVPSTKTLPTAPAV